MEVHATSRSTLFCTGMSTESAWEAVDTFNRKVAGCTAPADRSHPRAYLSETNSTPRHGPFHPHMTTGSESCFRLCAAFMHVTQHQAEVTTGHCASTDAQPYRSDILPQYHGTLPSRRNPEVGGSNQRAHMFCLLNCLPPMLDDAINSVRAALRLSRRGATEGTKRG